MAIYYVAHNGNAGHGGTNPGADAMDLQTACDTAVAGDEVRVCATGAYSFTAQIDIDTTSGTSVEPIRILGYNDAGSTQQEVTLTWTAGSYGLRCTKSYVHIVDFLVQRTGVKSGTGIYQSSFCTQDLILRCRATGWTTGIYAYGVNTFACACETYENTDGITVNSGVKAIGCVSRDNVDDGFSVAGEVIFCITYSNGGDGFEVLSNQTYYSPSLVQCTSALNSGDGIDITSDNDMRVIITGCICAKNDAYGIKSDVDCSVLGGGNLVPSGDTDDANVLGDFSNVTFYDAVVANLTGTKRADFISTTDGSEDLRISGNSDAKAAGWPGMLVCGTGYLDIGALQRQEPSNSYLIFQQER